MRRFQSSLPIEMRSCGRNSVVGDEVGLTDVEGLMDMDGKDDGAFEELG